jgi:hypothetical protein
MDEENVRNMIASFMCENMSSFICPLVARNRSRLLFTFAIEQIDTWGNCGNLGKLWGTVVKLKETVETYGETVVNCSKTNYKDFSLAQQG